MSQPLKKYYAVIFSTKLAEQHSGYHQMAEQIEELAKQQQGFLGIESVRNEYLKGITISYWRSEEDIALWKSQAKHLVAQQLGKDKWYSYYSVKVCQVIREYDYKR